MGKFLLKKKLTCLPFLLFVKIVYSQIETMIKWTHAQIIDHLLTYYTKCKLTISPLISRYARTIGAQGHAHGTRRESKTGETNTWRNWEKTQCGHLGPRAGASATPLTVPIIIKWKGSKRQNNSWKGIKPSKNVPRTMVPRFMSLNPRYKNKASIQYKSSVHENGIK